MLHQLFMDVVIGHIRGVLGGYEHSVGMDGLQVATLALILDSHLNRQWHPHCQSRNLSKQHSQPCQKQYANSTFVCGLQTEC